MADVACPSNEDASLFTAGLFLALTSVIPETIGGYSQRSVRVQNPSARFEPQRRAHAPFRSIATVGLANESRKDKLPYGPCQESMRLRTSARGQRSREDKDMDKKQCAFMVSLTIAAGLLGGAISARISTAPPALAETRPGSSQVISAEKFQVVDKNSTVRAVIDPKRIALFDKDGKMRFSLDTDIYGDPHVSLRDKDGTIRLMLGLDLDAKPYLGLADEDGEADIKLEVGDSGSFLYLSGKDPRNGVALGTDVQGTHLSLSDKEGRSRLWLTVDSNGEPAFNLFDQTGKLRAVLVSTELKDVKAGARENLCASSVVLSDKSEKALWCAP